MAGAMDASRIRELLLDFYQTHDPQRLAAGLDIFSMVIWTQKNGIDALNELLDDQYGVGIDPNKRLGGAKQDFKRFSTLMASSDRHEEPETRHHIREKLFEFYEEHDPSKLGRVDDFVQYIMMHGVDAFNRKLMNKYGEGISLEDDAMSGPPAPPARAAAPPAPPKRKSKNRLPPPPPAAPHRAHHNEPGPEPGDTADEDDDEDDLDDLPPPPPPTESMVVGEGIDDRRAKLREKLEGYYLDHDPAKLTHLDAIVEWGLGIGEEELEEKLIQLYGSGFSEAAPERKPSVVENVRRSLQSVAAAAGLRHKPIKPTPPPASRFKPAPPRAPKTQARGAWPPPQPSPALKKLGGGGPDFTATPPGVVRSRAGSFTGAHAQQHPPASRRPSATKPPPPRAKPTKPVSPWGVVDPSSRPTPIVRAEADANEDMPCNFYELDLTGASFGMCKCGYSRLAHVKGSSEYRHAMESRQRNGSAVARNARKFEPRKPAPPTREQEHAPAHEGFVAKAAQKANGGPKRADVVAHGGEKGGDHACNHFVLDLMSQSYGVCECGFPRDQHKAAAKAPAAARGGVGGFAQRLSRRVRF